MVQLPVDVGSRSLRPRFTGQADPPDPSRSRGRTGNGIRLEVVISAVSTNIYTLPPR